LGLLRAVDAIEANLDLFSGVIQDGDGTPSVIWMTLAWKSAAKAMLGRRTPNRKNKEALMINLGIRI